MEWLWACLLIVASLRRETRLLAYVLGIKWGVNYVAFNAVAEWAPVFVDIVSGTVAMVIFAPRRNTYTDLVLAGFVLAPLIHGSYWTLWYDVGAIGASVYYYSVIALFTAQTVALAFPGGLEGGRVLLDWLDRHLRLHVVGMAVSIHEKGRQGPEA